jgi:hypothetical protein
MGLSNKRQKKAELLESAWPSAFRTRDAYRRPSAAMLLLLAIGLIPEFQWSATRNDLVFRAIREKQADIQASLGFERAVIETVIAIREGKSCEQMGERMSGKPQARTQD